MKEPNYNSNLGDAISWDDLHNYDKLSFNDWD